MVGTSEASPGHIYKDLPEASGEGAVSRGEARGGVRSGEGVLRRVGIYKDLPKASGEGLCKGRKNLKQGRLGGAFEGVPGKRAPATYTKTCPRPPESGQCKGRRNLKQGRRVGGALKGVPGKGFWGG